MPATDTTAAKALKALPKAAQEVLRKQLDRYAKKLRDQAVDNITSAVSLTRSYVSARIKLVRTTQDGTDLVAGIQGTNNNVSLRRYPYKQLMGPAKNGGIKKHGVQGTVVRGKHYAQPKFFTLPLNSGTHIAVRTGQGRGAFKVLHSLSVNQLMQRNAKEIIQDLPDALATEVAANIVTQS